MTDRRALIVGSWLSKGRDRPSSQRVRSIIERWKSIFAEDLYGFRGLRRRYGKPLALLNPSVADLINELEGAKKITDETELLFYFVGHSVSVGENDIELILGVNEEGEDRLCSLSWLIDAIHRQTHSQKLVVVLDTCHAGRVRDAFLELRENSFAMFGTGDAYAFDANFSDGLLRALEQPIHKNDQRIDRRAGGITYQKIFEEARRRVVLSPTETSQDPKSFGDYGSAVLLKAPVIVPDEFNPFVSDRSIYGRMFRLLEIIRDEKPTFDVMRAAVRKDRLFLLEERSGEKDRYVSTQRLGEYLDFLRKTKWLVQPAGRLQLTPAGESACNREAFNKALRTAIENEVFSDGLTFDFLDSIVKDLLNDMIPPTPIRIKHRVAMKGMAMDLDVATRLAIQLLPSTGRFLKGSADAIFPSELG